jgi:hypothetical protein
MNPIKEKRNSRRMKVNCEIHCKLPETEKLIKAWCVSLSGSGISFICEQSFVIGAVVEVNILPETVLMPAMRFFISIIRCQTIENGKFEIGAQIQFDELPTL